MTGKRLPGSIIGMVALLGAITLFSTIEVASKAIQHDGIRIDPFIMVFVRFFLTGVCLIGLGSSLRGSRGRRYTARDYGVFMANGVIGITLGISLFHVAILAFRNASSSAVVFSANPVFVVLLSPIINGEKMTFRKVLSVVIGACGISLFAMESGGISKESVLGMTIMAASAFCFATSICISRRVISRYGAIVLMGYSALFGSLLVLPVGLWRSGMDGLTVLLGAWRTVLYLSLVGTALAYGLYYYGLGLTSAYRASVTFFLKPVLATILAVIFLGERLNAYTILGTLMIVGALVLAVVVLPSKATREGRSSG